MTAIMYMILLHRDGHVAHWLIQHLSNQGLDISDEDALGTLSLNPIHIPSQTSLLLILLSCSFQVHDQSQPMAQESYNTLP